MVTSTAQLAPAPPRRIPLWAAGGAFWGTVIAVLAARAAGLANVDALATFGVIFTSIMVEAVPFVLIGALVSATVAVYVPDRAFARLGRLPAALQVPGAAAAGLAFPVCECGSVPVARRLLLRGLHPEADAFVATSFTAFPVAAQLGFLVLGPIADVKLAVLYEATFRRGFVVRLLVLAVPVTLAGSLVYGAQFG